MKLFLCFFLTVYGSMHLYIFIRFLQAFRPSRNFSAMMFLFMGLATAAPILARLCEHAGREAIARFMAWGSYCWMGFIFILVSILLTLDIFRFAVMTFYRIRGCDASSANGLRVACELALILAIIVSIYGFFEARSIRTERITIQTAKIPATVNRIRIAQISDVHLGFMVQENRLKKILTIVKTEDPDILVSTGDLFDGRLSRWEKTSNYQPLSDLFESVKPSHGKFAITGNHEYYMGPDFALDVTKACGFQLLRNEYVELPNGIAIGGSDDPAWERASKSPPHDSAETQLLRSMPPDSFRVYLKHRPTVASQNDGLFDLQLSGHTHHGQIFPFYLLAKLQYPYCDGTTYLANGSIIHVSRGTGTWGPPIRFLAPPEITIIDIVPKKPTEKNGN